LQQNVAVLNILCYLLLVSTGAVSCYTALMVNLIWFTNGKCLSCQHWATWGHEIWHLAIQKRNHFASSMCTCTVLLQHVKVWLSPQTCKCNRFARFCGCNCKTSKICHQRTRFFTIRAG